MAPLKMTFSLDDETAARLERTAARLKLSKSAVVREAVSDFAARAGRLSEEERRRALRTFDELVEKLPRGSAARVDRELAQVSEARRSGGRRSTRTR